jgi:hypothetical protein
MKSGANARENLNPFQQQKKAPFLRLTLASRQKKKVCLPRSSFEDDDVSNHNIDVNKRSASVLL